MKHRIPYTTPAEERAYYIKATAHLIGRTVEYTEELVAKWPTKKVKKRYNEVTWYGMGSVPPPAVKWWALRKREVTKS